MYGNLFYGSPALIRELCLRVKHKCVACGVLVTLGDAIV